MITIFSFKNLSVFILSGMTLLSIQYQNLLDRISNEPQKPTIQIRMKLYHSNGELVTKNSIDNFKITGMSLRNSSYFKEPDQINFDGEFLCIQFDSPKKGIAWHKLVLTEKQDTMQLFFYTHHSRIVVDSVPFQSGCFSLESINIENFGNEEKWQNRSISDWKDNQLHCSSQIEMNEPILNIGKTNYFVNDTISVYLSKANVYKCVDEIYFQILKWHDNCWQMNGEIGKVENEINCNYFFLREIYIGFVINESGRFKIALKTFEVVKSTDDYDYQDPYGRYIKKNVFLYSNEFHVDEKN